MDLEIIEAVKYKENFELKIVELALTINSFIWQIFLSLC